MIDAVLEFLLSWPQSFIIIWILLCIGIIAWFRAAFRLDREVGDQWGPE